MLPNNKQVKQQTEQHTYREKASMSSNLKNTKKRYHKNITKAKLTRTAHRIQPICHSIHEQSQVKAQLEPKETVLSQTLKLTLQVQHLSVSLRQTRCDFSQIILSSNHLQMLCKKIISYSM